MRNLWIRIQDASSANSNVPTTFIGRIGKLASQHSLSYQEVCLLLRFSSIVVRISSLSAISPFDTPLWRPPGRKAQSVISLERLSWPERNFSFRFGQTSLFLSDFGGKADCRWNWTFDGWFDCGTMDRISWMAPNKSHALLNFFGLVRGGNQKINFYLFPFMLWPNWSVALGSHQRHPGALCWGHVRSLSSWPWTHQSVGVPMFGKEVSRSVPWNHFFHFIWPR